MSEVVATLEYIGKQYTVRQTYTNPEEDGVLFHWTDGNYGCDCNRKLFMSDADADFPDEPDENGWFPCGETVKLVGLTLDGKDLLAPTTHGRLAAIGLVGL